MSEPLGEYTIEEVLGEGGSAIVHAARLRTTDVALKVLRVDALTTPRQKARFLDEARLLAQVRHPSVVAVLDAGTLPDGRPFIAMPRLTGETLAARLARGPLALASALRMFEAIAEGVIAIHDAGLVHRDLKAENVFLTEDERPIVLDLGIARDPSATPSTTTEDGIVRGTPATMAPERFFGARASTASDVYELALLLYVMLVGALPWSDVGDVDARLAARPPHTLVDTIPQALSDAIMVALSTRIEKRPASVTALLASVRSATTGKGESEARRTSETPKREARSAAPPASTREEAAFREEASPLVEAPLASAPASTGRPHAPAAPRSKSGRSRVALGALAAAAVGVIAVGTAWRPHRVAEAPPAPVESSAALIAASTDPASTPAVVAATTASAPAFAASTGNPRVIASNNPTASANVGVPASGSAKAGAAAPTDPLAPCRAYVDLVCQPDLDDHAWCPAARENLQSIQAATADQQRREGERCQIRLDREARGIKEQIDRGHGRPTPHLGAISDAALDAAFPGCAYQRRTTCLRTGVGSEACKAFINLIETQANGTPAQQERLSEMCAAGAQIERHQREAIAKLRDGGAP